MQTSFRRVLQYEQDSVIKECELTIGPLVQLENSGDYTCRCECEPLFPSPSLVYGVDEIQALQLSFFLIKAALADAKSRGCEFWWLERGDGTGFD